MGKTLTEKIILSHLIDGEPVKGSEIGIKIDRTLTQDATGTMAYLQFEAAGIPRVKTDLSVAYIDHNTLQTGFENADDHAYIRSAAKKFGLQYSRPGSGICHQVNLERFAVPGATLIGSDSHTPTAGGIGSLAFGAGGLDVAVAMGGGAYYITMPRVVGITLTGKLAPGVSAKDVILEVLRLLTVKGGVGKVIEYRGDGVSALSVPERAVITNMGAELGATSSIFPSDSRTKDFLTSQRRERDYTELFADTDAVYDEEYTIDLSRLAPLAACPHSPDNIKPVSELAGKKINQVCIGSCTNSSYRDLMTVAAILKGKTVAENVSLTVSPGSKQVLTMLAANGALADIIAAGARILESACGPCIGMGQSPETDGVSLRTFNRNFEGRSGTKSAQVYLVSPETAAFSAVAGAFAVPDTAYEIPEPEYFDINDNLIAAPATEADADTVEITRGPNIKPFPRNNALPDAITADVILKVGDNITTDHIMPAGAKILPLRSNIPAISEHCFTAVDPDFPKRAKAAGQGFIVGGVNYGQGSSREHAALAPLYLGIKAVVVVSFARIHKQNLVNNGILPLEFQNAADYDKIAQSDTLQLDGLGDLTSSEVLTLKNVTKGETYDVSLDVSPRGKKILKAGGLLNYISKTD
ncbi:MAG: aconitate hydratase [Oscillospiraceae bacterium]|jgi:aconitate hydratase|nr:aconitate hydratase [Oscillospiraceae bacterium]